jgi:hypothetical protein
LTVKDIISSGGNEISVMISLLDEMPRVKAIIDSADKEELNKYCDSHDGFYRYMKILGVLCRKVRIFSA